MQRAYVPRVFDCMNFLEVQCFTLINIIDRRDKYHTRAVCWLTGQYSTAGVQGSSESRLIILPIFGLT
jgi:hypothetical protein